MDRLAALEIFVAVVDHGTFTAAADHLGISKSHASKQLRALEDRLGARLLNRTTRTLSLTDVGRAFYERCQRALSDLEDAERSVTAAQSSPRGTLRLSMPMTFGIRFINPLVMRFLCAHEDLSVEMSLSDRRVDLVDEGFDLAVRVGQLADSSLFARKLGSYNMVVVASPDYLERRGTPKTLADLRDHDCLHYTYASSNNTWHLTDSDGEAHAVRVEGRVKVNNGDVLMRAMLDGLGIGYVPDFFVGAELGDGRLVHILDDYGDDRGAVWAIYPHNRHLSAKVRLFVDFLVEAFDSPPWRR